MSKMTFRKATRKRARLRIAMTGPAGSGKTYSALSVASHLDQPVAVIDTEHGSSSLYAGDFDFSVLELETFEPQAYIDALEAAWEHRFPVVIIDSLSHAWAGTGGLLEKVDRLKASSRNKMAPWAQVTPEQNRLIQAVLSYPGHIIATMRTKTAWDLDTDDRKPKKVGLAPIQREGVDYEFDVVMEMDRAVAKIGKTRCAALHERYFDRPGRQLAEELKAWMEEGDKAAPTPAPAKLPEGHFPAADTGEVFHSGYQLTSDAPFDLGLAHSGLRLDELPPEVLDQIHADHIEGQDPKARWGEGSRELAFLRCVAKARATRSKKAPAPVVAEEEETPAPRALADDRAADEDRGQALPKSKRPAPSEEAKRRAMDEARQEARMRRVSSPGRSRSKPAKKESKPGEAERLRNDLWSFLRLGSEGEADERAAYTRLCIEGEAPPIRLEEQGLKDLRRLHQAAGLNAELEGVGA